jgi:hypothetical protein
LHVTYKVWPTAAPHPAFPGVLAWVPLLAVKIDYPAKHSPPSKRFEAVVDSGSQHTLFHSDIGKSIGIRVEKGIEASISGVVGGVKSPAFFHDVGLYVGADIIRIRAGFCDKLPVAGILGRLGFFDNFFVTFDQSSDPGNFEIQRIIRT